MKDDRDVTASDIANHNLILFGDPWSNSVIAKVVEAADQLDQRQDHLAGRTVDTATHAPVLVYPNPLNPSRYVVINGGHTFSDDGLARHERQPLPAHRRLRADRVGNESIAHSGFFDERWK